jgi:predicted nucleic acid-binding protein
VKHLIDTNIISEVRKGAKCDPHVANWYQSIDDADIYLSVLVVGEIRKGIERARRNNPAQARALEVWLIKVVRSFAERILPIDQAVADEWGRMSAKRSLSTIDALLAATAKVHEMALATRNISDVINLGVRVVNPFEQRT